MPRIERLLSDLAEQGHAVGPWQRGRAATLAGLVQLLDTAIEWNRRLDLTAARGHDELVDLFFADAVVLAALAEPHSSSWVDVGSGAGAPALPLQWLRPDLSFLLVEPKAKRVAFLRTCVGRLGALGLSRSCIRIQGARSAAIASSCAEVAVSRATFAPPQWLAEGARLATERVWVMLARHEPPQHPGWGERRAVRYRWPLTGAERRLVEYERLPQPHSPINP